MRKKFLIVLGIELLVAFLIVGGLSFFFLYPELVARADGALKEEGRSKARVIAASVADRCTEPILDDDEFVLGLIVSKTAEEYADINWIGVVDGEGATIAHTKRELAKKKIALPAGIQPVRDGDFVSGFYGSDMNSLWASYPIVIREARMGTVHLSMAMEKAAVGVHFGDLKTRALLLYLGLGVAATCLVMLLSARSIRNMTPLAKRGAGYVERDQKGVEEEVARRRKEETEIGERISSMKKKEKEMIARLRILKKQAETHEKTGQMETAPRLAPTEVSSHDSTGTGEGTPSGASDRKVPEKEKIEAIRRRIHELEERIRGE